tara:strand:- start:11981 stop:14332 length:2352 start_codon:yes stop_codon:yes gene_type:complete
MTTSADNSSMDMSAIIDSITCPITGDIMTDPVQGNDGHTYERTAILEWLGRNPISPQTRQAMSANDLKVNASIRFLCDKYHQGGFGNISRPKSPPKISTDSIKLDHTISKNSLNKTMLTFGVNRSSMPANLECGHLSQDVVLVIDRSGSTNSAVEAKDANGNKLENGMSILDIVIHSAKTVAKSLDKNSRLAVIAFDDRIEVVFDLMRMSEMNCNTAISKISTIKPRNQTNIWHSVEKAISILNDREDKSRNGAIMCLTDGMPNIKPARGEVETLKRLRKSLNFTSPIYTFGFGYALERGLLYDMAKHGGGCNGHIPDGSMIATVFCHSIATILSTVAVNLQLHITYSEDVNFVDMSPVMGDFVYNIDDSNPHHVVVDLGTVQLDQIRHIIMNTDHLKSNFSYYYTYKIGGRSCKSDVCEVELSILQSNESIINSNVCRFMTVETLRQIINFKTVGDDDTANEMLKQLEKLYSSKKMSDKLSQGIVANINGQKPGEGQIKLAVTNNEFFKRWGEFYLDQLSRSLNQEIKPNFRDTACAFGGDLFNSIVDKSSDVFDTLPPPEPSLINQRSYSYGGSSAPTPTRATTLAAYNSQDVGGGCFDSNCNITMADGSKKSLKNLIKGDRIKSIDITNNDIASVATVKCIFETKIRMGVLEVVNMSNGLIITPWHPVKTANGWEFPNNIGTPVIQACDSIITLVLDSNHVAFIQDTPCITLGHNFKEGILNHLYYGTNRVIDDLKTMPGWDNGHIVVYDNCITKINNITAKISYNGDAIRMPPTLIETC